MINDSSALQQRLERTRDERASFLKYPRKQPQATPFDGEFYLGP